MSRLLTYPNSIAQETDVLLPARFNMIDLGWALEAALGADPIAVGLGCIPASPANLTVTVLNGAITGKEAIDASAYSTLPADLNEIVKIGALNAPQVFNLTAPTGAGQRRKYLIQVKFNEVDAESEVVEYYNEEDPENPLQGIGGNNQSQFRVRKTVAELMLVPGTAAAAGSETIPGADAGWMPLWVITVSNGQSQITGAHIEQHVDAKFAQNRFEDYAPINSPAFTGNPTAPTPTLSNGIATKAYADSILNGAGVSTQADPNTIAKRASDGSLTATTFQGKATDANSADEADNALKLGGQLPAHYLTGGNITGTVPSAANANQLGGQVPAFYLAGANATGVFPDSAKLGGKTLTSDAVADTVALRDEGGNLTAIQFEGVAIKAEYGDVAEQYASDEALLPGHLVDIAGGDKVKLATQDCMGVISTNPALLMMAEVEGFPVGYLGKIPTFVSGFVNAGDYLELDTLNPGVARKAAGRGPTTIGRALETKVDAEIALVLALINIK